MPEEIASCPFCGSDAVIRVGYLGYHIECYGCHAEGPVKLEKKHAVAAWNKRHKEGE